MRITRILAGSAAVISAVAGVSLGAAGPAAAATGTWRAFGDTNPITANSSTWFCSDSKQIVGSVVAQTCVVLSTDFTESQPAVIVRNDKSVRYSASASVRISGDDNSTYDCAVSGVAPDSWSVCFGDTKASSHLETAAGTVNGHSAGTVQG